MEDDDRIIPSGSGQFRKDFRAANRARALVERDQASEPLTSEATDLDDLLPSRREMLKIVDDIVATASKEATRNLKRRDGGKGYFSPSESRPR